MTVRLHYLDQRLRVSAVVFRACLRDPAKSLLKPRGCGEAARMSVANFVNVLLFLTSQSCFSFKFQSPPAPQASFPRTSHCFLVSTELFFCVQNYLFAVFYEVIYFQHLFSLDLLEMWSYLSLAQVIHFNCCLLN